DVQWNDIDYMDNYKDWTYSPENFGNLPSVIADLHANKQRYIIMAVIAAWNLLGIIFLRTINCAFPNIPLCQSVHSNIFCYRRRQPGFPYHLSILKALSVLTLQSAQHVWLVSSQHLQGSSEHYIRQQEIPDHHPINLCWQWKVRWSLAWR
ncbi:lysosomal alpha-glucosidase, partial [Elysia marginata]